MKRRTLRMGLVALIATWTLSPSWLKADQGWTAQVEHLLLDPTISDSGVDRIFYFGGLPSASDQFGSIDSSLQYSTRLTLAAEGGKGGGAQLRWFRFDQDPSYTGVVEESPTVLLNGGLNLNLDSLDFELTQRGRFGLWDWLVTGGARYANYSLREQDINFEDLSDFAWSGSTGVEFEGAGPTLSVLGERPVGSSGISIFGRARTALLFGDTDMFSAFRSGGVYRIEDVVQVWEIQFGTNVNRRYESFDVLGGIFWEAQRWDSDSDLLGDLALHGFGVTTGLRY